MHPQVESNETGSKDCVDIDAFIKVLRTGLEELHSTAISLETALSRVICHDNALDASTIQALQSLDYSRQYARDLLAVLQRFGGQVMWEPGTAIPIQDFSDTVDMKGTIAPLTYNLDQTVTKDQDIWF